MDPVKLLIYAQVAIGIGLVIFVHELGHFLAARLCGVRVEVFSLGFGPKLFSWKRNGTVYQLALLPLGGFVRMAGEDRFSGEPHGPDDLPSKSVGARFLIYSGGVIMNVVFGLVVFPLVLFHGVPFLEPVVGQAQPGGPAWHAGIEPGTRILEINGNPIVSFEYIANEVALGPPESTRLLIQAPGESAPREVTLRPEYDRVAGLNRVQVVPSFDLSLGFAVQPGSPAAEAGLRDGDRLVGVRDGLPGLTLVEQLDGAFQDAGPVGFSVERPADDGTSERIDFELAPHVVELKGTPALGVSPRFGLLEGTRANADLEAFGLQAGDRMLEVDGRAIQRPLDLERALVAGGEQARAVQMIVARGGRELTLNSAAELERTRRVRLSRDMALTYDLDGEVVMVAPGGAAALAGLLDGDRILRLDGAPVENWEEVRTRIRAHRSDLPLRIEVERVSAEGQASVVDLSASLAAPTSIEYGVGFHLATYVYQASGFGDAVRVGVASSWKFVVDTYLTLKRILFGQVSSENIGGIITIAAVSASWAEEGLAKLLFILCMLSMNLAFINVLPIPVLDGGHLFFLAVEKIKGSPVSERVLGYSQVVGVVLILSLMIYVTYNDLMRWVFTG